MSDVKDFEKEQEKKAMEVRTEKLADILNAEKAFHPGFEWRPIASKIFLCPKNGVRTPLANKEVIKEALNLCGIRHNEGPLSFKDTEIDEVEMSLNGHKLEINCTDSKVIDKMSFVIGSVYGGALKGFYDKAEKERKEALTALKAKSR